MSKVKKYTVEAPANGLEVFQASRLKLLQHVMSAYVSFVFICSSVSQTDRQKVMRGAYEPVVLTVENMFPTLPTQYSYRYQHHMSQKSFLNTLTLISLDELFLAEPQGDVSSCHSKGSLRATVPAEQKITI